MKLKNLTSEDWDAMIRLVSKRSGESDYTLEQRVKVLKQIKESYISGQTRIKGYLQEAVKQAFGKPFKKIPLLLKEAEPIEAAIYKFRLEKGG